MINEILSGGVPVALLFACGVYYTARSGFFQLRGLPSVIRDTAGTLLKKTNVSRGGITPFQAVSTALAGTMGVGNIAGVSTAVIAGGPGAILWMCVGALFGMMTKYAEIFLAVKYRRKDKEGRFFGGPMYYIEHGMGKKWLACLFALLCAACSAGVGNLTQVNAVSTAMLDAFGVPLWLSGLVVAIIVGLVVAGGLKRIAGAAELVIPFMSILYLCVSIAFLYLHRAFLADALLLIAKSAFAVRPAAGGALGYGVLRAARIGLARGVFTNEAGLGSAPIAHAGAVCQSPSKQAVWGIFEVFVDTIVVCTITGLVILTAGGGRLWQSGLDGAPLTSAAFASVYGKFGAGFIAVAILFFAVTSIWTWYYYGEQSLRYLFSAPSAAIAVYRVAFISLLIVGSMASLGAVWAIADIFTALMAIPNLVALFALRNEVATP